MQNVKLSIMYVTDFIHAFFALAVRFSVDKDS